MAACRFATLADLYRAGQPCSTFTDLQQLVIRPKRGSLLCAQLRVLFGRYRDCQSIRALGRRFFENWRASLKWQRLKPYEKFAEMIDRHWDGIAAYCRPENKVSLGFVEGLNNKIRVI